MAHKHVILSVLDGGDGDLVELYRQIEDEEKRREKGVAFK